jgi:hypothetical protein
MFYIAWLNLLTICNKKDLFYFYFFGIVSAKKIN